MAHARRQIELIARRVIQGEPIPHHEKVFSIFEEHTEWISKGKAGVPQELGLRVCILEDQYRFILHHQVMEQQTDDQVAIAMVKEGKKRFPPLNSCSFDKGFYSPGNRKVLEQELDLLVLPKKGKLTAQKRSISGSPPVAQARKKHSAVESAINGLENHGLNRCPDDVIEGFKRYVALAVVGRNLQILGDYLQKKEQKRIKRKERQRYRERLQLWRNAA